MARNTNENVHLFALEQLFCSVCALCSSQMKVSGLTNMDFTSRAGDTKMLMALAAGRQHVLKGTWANVDLVVAAAAVVVIVVFEAQFASLNRLDIKFK